MPKVLQFQTKNKDGKIYNSGSMEIKNVTNSFAELYFYGDIVSDQWGKWTDEDKCPSDITNFLKDIEDVQSIDVHINSGGGSVWGGIAIYNQLKRYKATVTTYIDGLAASIASIIAMAGDKIVMPNNSMLMIHKPMNVYYYSMLNAEELRKDADALDVAQRTMLNTYITKAKAGVTEEQITNMVDAETWLTAEEATKYFDVEIEGIGAAVACHSNLYDKYKNVPESLKSEDDGAKGNGNIDVDKLVDLITEKINQNVNKIEVTNLLKDLDQYGK